MAEELDKKKVTALSELTTTSDNDLYITGEGGQAPLRKISFGTIAAGILNKLSTWTFDALNTTAKTLTGAINELNSRSAIVNWRAYSDIGTAMQTEFANYVDGAYNLQAILSGGAMYEIVASVRQGSGSIFWSVGTYTIGGKVYSFDVTSTGIAIKDYQGQIDALNSKMAIKYKTYGATGITISANGAVAITGTMLGMTEYPTGYAPIGLVGYDLGANNYLTTRYIAPRQVGGNTVMIIANQTSNAVTGNVSITIAYAPSSIVSSL